MYPVHTYILRREDTSRAVVATLTAPQCPKPRLKPKPTGHKRNLRKARK